MSRYIPIKRRKPILDEITNNVAFFYTKYKGRFSYSGLLKHKESQINQIYNICHKTGKHLKFPQSLLKEIDVVYDVIISLIQHDVISGYKIFGKFYPQEGPKNWGMFFSEYKKLDKNIMLKSENYTQIWEKTGIVFWEEKQKSEIFLSFHAEYENKYRYVVTNRDSILSARVENFPEKENAYLAALEIMEEYKIPMSNVEEN